MVVNVTLLSLKMWVSISAGSCYKLRSAFLILGLVNCNEWHSVCNSQKSAPFVSRFLTAQICRKSLWRIFGTFMTGMLFKRKLHYCWLLMIVENNLFEVVKICFSDDGKPHTNCSDWCVLDNSKDYGMSAFCISETIFYISFVTDFRTKSRCHISG